MRTVQIMQQEEGQRLDKFLGKYMALAPKSFLYKMLRKKNIVLNGKKAGGMEKLTRGDVITLYLSEETLEKFSGGRQTVNFVEMQGSLTEKETAITVIYEDEEILVINKPAGMLSQKARKEDISLSEYISAYLSEKEKQNLPGFRPGVCNRLDRNTTGLVMAGKTVRSLQYLNRLFQERALHKYYLCLVKGKLTGYAEIDGYLQKDEKHNKVLITDCPGEAACHIRTAYEPLACVSWQQQEYTLLQVDLITGKSHQIRAHLKSIGHPVAGDAKYGEKTLYHLFKKEFGVSSQLLHAWKVCLGSAEYLPEKYWNKTFAAPLPEIFYKTLKEMGFSDKVLCDVSKP